MHYSTPSSSRWSDISTTAKGAFNNPKDVAGFNVGLSAKIKLPVVSFICNAGDLLYELQK